MKLSKREIFLAALAAIIVVMTANFVADTLSADKQPSPLSDKDRAEYMSLYVDMVTANEQMRPYQIRLQQAQEAFQENFTNLVEKYAATGCNMTAKAEWVCPDEETAEPTEATTTDAQAMESGTSSGVSP